MKTSLLLLLVGIASSFKLNFNEEGSTYEEKEDSMSSIKESEKQLHMKLSDIKAQDK